MRFPVVLWFLSLLLTHAAERPNVLFISLDDLNDWVGCLGGHPQAKTPHIDALARSGMLFRNAHCPAASCNPSRTAVMSGIPPWHSGLYTNRQKMREILPDAELLPRTFARQGYKAMGSGKLLHYFIDARSWDYYYPKKETEMPFPPHTPWGKRPKSLPRAGPWQYGETDWHAFDVSDEEFGGDVKVADWVADELSREHDKPFFLACGIYRPHEPWFVPKRYFDLYPLEEVKMPPGLKEDDLADVPPLGQSLGPNRYLKHIREHGQWQRGVQAYLASISFADAMVGRVMRALAAGPHADNTIVVLWGDHGWHLGEKEHWQKFTGWRVCTRVPLIIRRPGVGGGHLCDRPVSLLSLHPTLLELAGLPAAADAAAPSLLPLLEDPEAEWKHVAITTFGNERRFAISAENWRYIHYDRGGIELYDIEADPFEWTNLAYQPGNVEQLKWFRERTFKNPVPFVRPDRN